MTRFVRIIFGLSCCLIIGLIILGGGGLERNPPGGGISLPVRKEMASRFRVEDEEDLHWKLMKLRSIGSDGHSMVIKQGDTRTFNSQ